MIRCLLLVLLGLFPVGDAIGWVDGTPYFFEHFQEWSAPTESLRAPVIEQDPRFQVGQQKTFYAIDFRGETQYTVGATLRAVGRFCYVFVEDTQWLRRVSAADVENIRRAFDDATPADPQRGIYEIETTAFGPPPDIDNDLRVTLLLLDVIDQFLLGGNFIAGYFSPVNQQFGTVRDPNHGVLFHSNEAEMIYLDVHPSTPGDPEGLGVLAHEFQHLIHWRYDTNEDIWVNEGCSDYAMFLCGYDVSDHVRAFERSPQVSLVEWDSARLNQLANYGAAYLWMLYLHEHYGGEATLARLVSESPNGMRGIINALSARGYTSDVRSLFADWMVANVLDDPSLGDGRYGYMHEELALSVQQTHASYPVSRTTGDILAWGMDAIRFENGTGGGNLIVDFVEPLARYPMEVRAVQSVGGQATQIDSVALSDAGHGYLSVGAFGQRVDQVLLVSGFVPMDASENIGIARYEYEARIGEQVSFQVEVLQNPVQPGYWDVLVRAAHHIGAEPPQIRVTESGVVRLADQPMPAIQDGVLFGTTFYVPPGREPERIHWRVEYLGALLGEGVFGRGN